MKAIHETAQPDGKRGKGAMKVIRYGIIAAIIWYIWKRYKDARLPEYTLPRLHE